MPGFSAADDAPSEGPCHMGDTCKSCIVPLSPEMNLSRYIS
jgi:hypothetical protein